MFFQDNLKENYLKFRIIQVLYNYLIIGVGEYNNFLSDFDKTKKKRGLKIKIGNYKFDISKI